MPATDTRDFDREFEQLVRDLRALPTAAPQHVRERVRALGEPEPSRNLWDLPHAISWRRSLLVLAPVCVLALVSAAFVHGVLSSGGKSQPVSLESIKRNPAAPATDSGSAQGGALRSQLAPVPAPPGRYQDYQASLSLRLKDVETLQDRTAEATRLARSYGGYVVSVFQSSAGATGQSDVVMRIPVTRVQEAYFRLSKLGTVTNQQLSIASLDEVVRNQRNRIVRLKVQIARITAALQSTSLPADVRVRLELQRDSVKAELARATGANKTTLGRASYARIYLSLSSPPAAAATTNGTGRIGRAARNAGSFLAGAGAVVLFLLIVLSPLIVLVAAGLWGSRAYRRREERRLLAHP
jgi:Domain of unknown function (DUF4349)